MDSVKILFNKYKIEHAKCFVKAKPNFPELIKLNKRYWGVGGHFDQVSVEQFHDNDFAYILSLFLKQNNVINIPLLKQIASHHPELFASSLKISEIILNKDRWNSHGIDVCKSFSDIIHKTAVDLDYLSSIYKHIENQYLESLKYFKGISHSELSLLVAAQFVRYQFDDIKQIQKDSDKAIWQNISSCISQILNDLKIHQKIDRTQNYEKIHYNLIDIYISDIGSDHLKHSEFDVLIQSRVKLDFFKNSVWEPYSLNMNFSLVTKKENTYLCQTAHSAKQWDKANQKTQAEKSYWLNYGTSKINSFLGTTLDGKISLESKTLFNLKEGFGISDVIILNGKEVKLESIVKLFGHLNWVSSDTYIREFNEGLGAEFKEMYPNQPKWKYALTYLLPTYEGLFSSSRMSYAFLPKAFFYENYSEFVNSQEECEAIFDAFTFREGSNLLEQPFIPTNDGIIYFPFMFAHLDLNTTILNTLLRIQNSNGIRKNEVSQYEKKVAEYFNENDFAVCTGLEYRFKCPITNDLKSGEIDVIAFKDNHLFILELKTSLTKINEKDIINYLNADLFKAKNQLDRILEFKEKDPSGFTNLLKENRINLPNVNLEIHTYIVDTSFEFDHELIGKHLKISHLELRMVLKNDLYFTAGLSCLPERLKWTHKNPHLTIGTNLGLNRNDYLFINHQMEKYNLYPNGFNTNQFIKNIEYQKVWQFLDDDHPLAPETRQLIREKISDFF